MTTAVLDRAPEASATPSGGAAPADGGGRLEVLDVLRGLAVLLVIWFHADATFLPDTGWRGLVKDVGDIGGQTGVALFLVLSGFSIHLRQARRAGRPDAGRFRVWTFLKRRWLRIVPTYWAALVVSIVLLGIARHETGLHRPSLMVWGGLQPAWLSVANHLLVVGMNVLPAAYFMRGWSLAAEGQLYGIYAAIQRWWGSVDPWRLVIGAAVLSVGWRAVFSWVLDLGPTGLAQHLREEVLLQWALPVAALPFALGYLGAAWHAGRVALPRWMTSITLGLAGLALAVHVHDAPLWTVGVAGRPIVVDQVLWHPLVAFSCATLVLGAVRQERWVASRFGRKLAGPVHLTGRWSYSMYLMHPPVWLFTYEILHLRDRWLGVWVGLGLVYLVSGLLHRFVEQPWMRRSAAAGRPKPSAPVEPAEPVRDLTHA